MGEGIGSPVRVRRLHAWNVSPLEACAIQDRLRSRLSSQPPVEFPRTVAGADVAYDLSGPFLFAAVVVIDMASLKTIDQAALRAAIRFPYIPGLLSFREAPPLLRLFRRLHRAPDALVCDGHGVAHPRRFGLACHLGLLLDLPSLGCAKSCFVGDYGAPGPTRGSFEPLVDGGETVGSVLRTQDGVQPLFVSSGHRMNLETAREIVLRLTHRYRLPETTRRAHHCVGVLRGARPAARRRDR